MSEIENLKRKAGQVWKAYCDAVREGFCLQGDLEDSAFQNAIYSGSEEQLERFIEWFEEKTVEIQNSEPPFFQSKFT